MERIPSITPGEILMEEFDLRVEKRKIAHELEKIPHTKVS